MAEVNIVELVDLSSKKKTVSYHIITSCNSCGGDNSTVSPSVDEGGIYESKTKCNDCGFEDYWAYGFYESSQNMVGKCKTFTR